MISSPDDLSTARLRAVEQPRLWPGERMRRFTLCVCAAVCAFAKTSGVLSVEPLSTTIISKPSGRVLRRLRRQLRVYAAWLWARMMTETMMTYFTESNVDTDMILAVVWWRVNLRAFVLAVRWVLG